jgi:hypothetical protein
VPANEDEILARLLGSVGGRGAKFAARLLRTDVHEIEIVLMMPPGDAIDLVHEALNLDQLRSAEWWQKDSAIVHVVVWVGLGKLNPALVTVSLAAEGATTTRVHIRGAAKEGLIKQHGGRQAAHLVAAALQPAHPPR